METTFWVFTIYGAFIVWAIVQSKIKQMEKNERYQRYIQEQKLQREIEQAKSQERQAQEKAAAEHRRKMAEEAAASSAAQAIDRAKSAKTHENKDVSGSVKNNPNVPQSRGANSSRNENMERIVTKNVAVSINGKCIVAPELERLLFGESDLVDVNNCSTHTFYFYPDASDRLDLCKTVMAKESPHTRYVFDIKFPQQPEYNGKFEWTRHGHPPESHHEWGFRQVFEDTPLGKVRENHRAISKLDLWLEDQMERTFRM